MEEMIDSLFNNFDSIVEAVSGIFAVIGGCSIFSSFLPKIAIDAVKVTQKLTVARQVVKVLARTYNSIVSAINLGGFNFGKAKNKE